MVVVALHRLPVRNRTFVKLFQVETGAELAHEQDTKRKEQGHDGNVDPQEVVRTRQVANRCQAKILRNKAFKIRLVSSTR